MPEIQPTEPLRKWLTVFEAAEYFHCAPNHIRNIIHKGELRAARFGQGFRIDRADLDQLMMKRKQRVAPYRRGTHPWTSKYWASKRRKRAAR